ncbi:MAG: hypothetical protein AB7J30_00235 [Hyphomicrobium sp.]
MKTLSAQSETPESETPESETPESETPEPEAPELLRLLFEASGRRIVA